MSMVVSEKLQIRELTGTTRRKWQVRNIGHGWHDERMGAYTHVSQMLLAVGIGLLHHKTTAPRLPLVFSAGCCCCSCECSFAKRGEFFSKRRRGILFKKI